MKLPSVFILYARADGSVFASELSDDLTIDGASVWFDRNDIEAGDRYHQRIAEGLRAAQAVLLVLTPGAVAAEYVEGEWTEAQKRKIPLFPLLVADCELPVPLTNVEYIDFRADRNVGMARLRKRLRALSEDIESQQLRIQAGLENERREVVRNSTREKVERSRTAGQRLLDIRDHFKGRNEQQVELGRRLADAATHVVSVVGRAGIGKTALASKVLADLEQNRWPHTIQGLPVDGIAYLSTRTSGISLERIFLDCAAMAGGDGETALQKVWASPTLSAPEKVQRLLDALTGGVYILLLDHFEDLLDDEARITDPQVEMFFETCLATPQSVRLVVTSRIPIALQRHLLRFNLQVPLQEGLAQNDAVAMLRELDPNGTSGLRDAPAESLARAVTRLHGVPRALEVLAGILEDEGALRSLDEILEKFYQREDVEIQLIKEGYERLDDRARLVMQALAVFGRPVPLLAVDYLLQPFAPGIDAPGIAQRLMRALMVRADAGRAIMLHPIDEDYAYSQIPAAGPLNRAALEARAADYYAQIRPGRDHWRSLAGLEPLLFEFEHRFNSGDYDAAAELLAIFDVEYLIFGGHAARALQMHESLERRISRRVLLLKHTFAVALARTTLGLLPAAIEGFRAAVDLAGKEGDDSITGESLGWIGEVSRRMGRLEEALEPTTSAVAVFARLGDTAREARWRGELSLLFTYRGELKKGLEEAHHALELAQTAADVPAEALAYDALALCSLVAGQYADTHHWAGKAIETYLDSLWAHTTMYVLNTRALASLGLGHVDEAIADLQDALRQAREDNDTRVEGLAHFNLARAWRLKPDAQQALAEARAAQETFQHMGAGEVAAARALVEALAAAAAGLSGAEARALVACARASIRTPDLCSPRDLLTHAREIAERDGLPDVAREAASLLVDIDAAAAT